MAKKPIRIGIMLSEVGEFNRRAVQGVVRYIHEHRLGWVANPSNPEDAGVMASWKPDGVIATVVDEAMAVQLRQLAATLRVPPVVVRPRQLLLPQYPHVLCNDVRAGWMGAEHLWHAGYRHLAFFGARARVWSDQRGEGVAAFAAEHALPCARYDVPIVRGSRLADDAGARAWLESLPRPVGILACSDYGGFELTELCRRLGRQVPRDVGLIGVEDDSHWCLLASPHLSTIDNDALRCGYEAARLMHRALTGQPLSAAPVLIEPLHVVPRASSDVHFSSDPVVSQAVRYIHEHSRQPLSVKVLADAITVSLRSLSRAFAAHWSRSPFAEIRSARIGRVCQLLRDTDLTPGQIARQCGFRDVSRMSVLFRREMARTPGEYRRAYHTDSNGLS